MEPDSHPIFQELAALTAREAGLVDVLRLDVLLNMLLVLTLVVAHGARPLNARLDQICIDQHINFII